MLVEFVERLYKSRLLMASRIVLFDLTVCQAFGH